MLIQPYHILHIAPFMLLVSWAFVNVVWLVNIFFTRVLKNILFLIASFNWIHVTVALPNLIHVSCVWLIPYWVEFLYFTLLHVQFHCCRFTYIHIYCCKLIYYFRCFPFTRWCCSETTDNCGESPLLCFRPLYSIQIIKGQGCSPKLKRFLHKRTGGPFVFLFLIYSSCIFLFRFIVTISNFSSFTLLQRF